MKRFSPRDLTVAAMTGGLYVVLSYFGNIFGLTYGPIQCRFSEALTVLPFLCPATTWGLLAGCVLANLLSPYGPLDLIFGSLATLAAGLMTARCKNRWLAPLPPVLCNGVLVGFVITIQEVPLSPAFWGVYAYNAATVALGELAACYILGSVLLALLPKTGLLPRRER